MLSCPSELKKYTMIDQILLKEYFIAREISMLDQQFAEELFWQNLVN